MVWAIVSTNLFAKAFGGTNDDQAYSIVQTSDGGYAVAGMTESFGAGDKDLLVLKLSPTGSLEWAKTFGGTNHDRAYSIVQTSDGGYAVAGWTSSFGVGYYDLLVLKLSPTGSLEWAKTFGGTDEDYAYSIIQTSDGGYAVAGWTWSFGVGEDDFLVIKLSPTGSLEWARTFGGTSYDYACSVVQTSDGGYAVAGASESFSVGSRDFLVIKLSPTGSLEWARTFGGRDLDYARSIIQTSDGGYAVAGWTWSFGVGEDDFLVLKLSPTGSLEWAKTFGGEDWDEAYSIIQTSDGGYAVAGYTKSFGVGKDFLILKLSPDGSLEWARTFGIGSYDHPYSIIQTSDGGYAVAGFTQVYHIDLFVLRLPFDGLYENCVHDVTPTEQNVFPTVTSLPFSISSPNLSSTSPSVSVFGVPLLVTDICPPSASPSPRLTYSPFPGGLLLSSEEPTQVKIYSVSGRLVKSLLVEGKVRVSLKPGVYLLRWPGGGGAAAVK